MGDLRSADVHGHDGVLPALAAPALGGVPEQILQGRRLQVQSHLRQEIHSSDEEGKC